METRVRLMRVPMRALERLPSEAKMRAQARPAETMRGRERARQTGGAEERHAVRGDGDEQAQQRGGEQDSGYSAEGGEHKRFGERLLEQAESSGAYGSANGYFVLARRAAGGKEAGYVGAGDQQNGHHQGERTMPRGERHGTGDRAAGGR